MPSCSLRTTWYGPATRATRYVDSGCVSASVHSPAATSVAGVLPRTTQSRGARTRIRQTALRSGWSKHPKMLGAASRKVIA